VNRPPVQRFRIRKWFVDGVGNGGEILQLAESPPSHPAQPQALRHCDVMQRARTGVMANGTPTTLGPNSDVQMSRRNV
jgi:hypothetical protein